MHDAVLVALVEHDEDGRVIVRAPEVGWCSELPAPGACVAGESRIARLTRLGRRFDLVLPAGIAGRVDGELSRQRTIPVEYGETLLVLAPLETLPAGVAASAGAGADEAAGIPPGARAVFAPTDGIFYRRPAPDEPPFVEVGSSIAPGQPVGLVEVMKTFNQILYESPGTDAPGRVREVRCSDGEEVQSGQVLVVVESPSTGSGQALLPD